jgi:hypothetical protein
VLRINEDQPGVGLAQAGMLCLQSLSNATISGLGNGYGFAYRASNLELFQFSGGLSNQYILSQGSFPLSGGVANVPGPAAVLQLQWAVSGNTVTLIAQAGFGLVYGALSALYSAVLLTSTFTSTAGEGFFAYQIGDTSGFDVSMDVTQG